MKHMENGGHIFRITKDHKHDRFFYKLENGELMCRVNELGGWHPAHGGIRWETDDLKIAECDYDTEGFRWKDMKTIYKKLPTLEETTGYKTDGEKKEHYCHECIRYKDCLYGHTHDVGGDEIGYCGDGNDFAKFKPK